jgi:geranylgeranyl reductase family protein
MNEKLDAEIIVVGGGPAGISTAKTLFENGIDVLLIDMVNFPRRKVCAGGLAYHTVKEFPFVQDFIDTQIKSYVVHSPNMLYSCTVNSTESYMSMTKSRTDFDDRMFKMLQAMNCRTITGEKVINVIQLPSKILVETNIGHQYSCLTVVGADSAVSAVSQSLKIGLFHPNIDRNKSLGLAFEKDYNFSNNTPEYQKIHIYLHFKDIRGYAWSFPRSVGTNLGLGGQTFQVKERKVIFKDFEEIAFHEKMMPADAKGSELVMGLIPNTKPYKHSIVDRVILVGDAGGFCANTTGDGIYYGLKSGQIVGQFLSTQVQLFRALNAQGKADTTLNALFSTKGLKRCKKFLRPIINELNLHYIISNTKLKDFKFANTFIRWASYDTKMAQTAIELLLGKVSPQRVILPMAWQILRCYWLDLFHKLGDKSKD